MKIKHIDHIEINVNVERVVDRIIELKSVKDDIVMLKAPDGKLNLELIKFHHQIRPRRNAPIIC